MKNETIIQFNRNYQLYDLVLNKKRLSTCLDIVASLNHLFKHHDFFKRTRQQKYKPILIKSFYNAINHDNDERRHIFFRELENDLRQFDIRVSYDE